MSDTATAPERLVGSAEAERRVHLSRDTLHRYVKRGILHAVRTPGGAYRFRVEDLDALLQPAGPAE